MGKKNRNTGMLTLKPCEATVDNIIQNVSLKPGDCVKINKGDFLGLYALILEKSYGDEWEIQYFEKSYGKWVLKKNDLDSRAESEMIKVVGQIDNRERYTFCE